VRRCNLWAGAPPSRNAAPHPSSRQGPASQVRCAFKKLPFNGQAGQQHGTQNIWQRNAQYIWQVSAPVKRDSIWHSISLTNKRTINLTSKQSLEQLPIISFSPYFLVPLNMGTVSGTVSNYKPHHTFLFCRTQDHRLPRPPSRPISSISRPWSCGKASCPSSF